jgi:hypothetical protein
MKCDFSKKGVLRPTKKSAMPPCDKEASQFMIISWEGMSPWAKALPKPSSQRLIARCVDHMIADADARKDLVLISEQDAIVFKTHEE